MVSVKGHTAASADVQLRATRVAAGHTTSKLGRLPIWGGRECACFPPLFILALDTSCYSFFIFWSCSSALLSRQSSLRDVSVIKQALRFHICRRKRLKSKWELPLSLRGAGPHVHRAHPRGSHASLKSLSALNNLLRNPAMKPPPSLC